MFTHYLFTTLISADHQYSCSIIPGNTPSPDPLNNPQLASTDSRAINTNMRDIHTVLPFEIDIIYLILSIILIVLGAGAFSVDSVIGL
ncbi:MAG: hypothetical protein M3P08_15305 [Thermoproteota archaeon]|nr:hypothetical protein [Thermoproteota archaeon]